MSENRQTRLVIAEGQGTSMFPFSPPGTILFFEPAQRYRVGDVVLFENQGRDIAHRVVKVCGERVVTWGDWTVFPDPPHERSDLKGRCTAMLRKGTPIYMDWPGMRVVNSAFALLIPPLKTVLRPLLLKLKSPQR